MHYDVDYKGLTPEAKYKKAIQDIKEYLGEKKFYELTELFKQYKDMTMTRFEAYCSISGIRFYPVEAWYKFCYETNSPWDVK